MDVITIMFYTDALALSKFEILSDEVGQQSFMGSDPDASSRTYKNYERVSLPITAKAELLYTIALKAL